MKATTCLLICTVNAVQRLITSRPSIRHQTTYANDGVFVKREELVQVKNDLIKVQKFARTINEKYVRLKTGLDVTIQNKFDEFNRHVDITTSKVKADILHEMDSKLRDEERHDQSKKQTISETII